MSLRERRIERVIEMSRRRRLGPAIGSVVVLMALAACTLTHVPAAQTRSTATAPSGTRVPARAAVPVGGVVQVINLPSSPYGVGFGFGSVWVAVDAVAGGLLLRIDPATDKIVARIPVGAFATRIAAGLGALWVTNSADGTLSRIDPSSNHVTATIAVGADPFGVGVDAGMVWVGESDTEIVRVDPATNRRVQTVRLGAGNRFRGLSAGFGSVWTVSADGRVTRLDSATGRIIAEVEIPNCCDGEFAITKDAVWMSNVGDHRVRRIDPATNRVVAAINVNAKPFGIGVAGGLVWVTHGNATGQVSRISPKSGTVLGVTPVAPFAGALAVGAGGVWVPSFDAQVLYRIASGPS